MKIAIVHDYLTKIGGAEKVLLEIHKLFPEAPIFTLLYDEKGTKSLFASEKYKVIPSKLQKMPSFLRKRPKLLFSRLAQAIEELDLSKYDVVISDSNSFAHGVITKPETVHICYCYSPMRYAWDWSAEYAEENHIGFGLLGLLIRKKIYDLRIWDRLAADRVDYWIAISGTVQNRIKKYYRADASIIYPPTDLSRFALNDRKRDNFYLIVSRLSPYKKVDLAIEAANKAGIKLKIIGEGSDLARLQTLSGPNIEFLGWQSDEVVARLMRETKALIFPGEEDFGLTPVEAMACGTPVLGLNKGGTTETILDGKTGYLFDGTAEDLVLQISKIEKTSLDHKFIRSHAEQFSLEKFNKEFASKIDEYYKEYNKSIV